jgi:transcriptional regulator with XRE-family HTH domain
MGSRERTIDASAVRGREVTAELLSELRHARLDRDLSEATLGALIGVSGSQNSRIERGLTRGPTIEQAVMLLAGVGLELSARTFPAGEPLRDAGHVALLERFRRLLHGSLRVRTEVPFPRPGDLRAWDLVILGSDWKHAYEAETRPRDRQALERRMALKARDGDVEAVSLLLTDSRHNRDFVRFHATALQERFPVPGRRAVAALAAGENPGAGSVILL